MRRTVLAVTLFLSMTSISVMAEDKEENDDITIVKPEAMELAPEKTLREPRETTVEVHAGINLSNYSSGYESTSMKPGLMVGVGFDIPLKPIFSLNPELNFSMLGAKVTLPGGIEAKERLNYIEIPLYCKFILGKSNKVYPYLAVAPTVNIGFSGSRIYFDENVVLIEDEEKKVPLFSANQEIEAEEANYRKADFSVNFKAGVMLRNGFSVAAGYKLGLVNIARSSYNWSAFYGYDKMSVRNNAIFVSLGYAW